MARTFVAKRHRKHLKIPVILILILLLLIIYKIDLKYEKNLEKKLFDVATNNIRYDVVELLHPKDLYLLGLNYSLDVQKNIKIDELEYVQKHTNSSEPLVYIYNTHDTETYDSSLLETYNIKYTVKLASHILSEYLSEENITSYVEKEQMSDHLSANGLLYKDSYKASRYYFEKRIAEYPEIKIAIDLHRDSVSRSATTAIIDGKNYAKVMEVVGLDYSGYEKNRDFAYKFNELLDERLSRGVIEKTGQNVNGIYNQDLKEGTLLLEIGGVDNTIEEVSNTLKIISRAIKELIKEG